MVHERLKTKHMIFHTTRSFITNSFCEERHSNRAFFFFSFLLVCSPSNNIWKVLVLITRFFSSSSLLSSQFFFFIIIKQTTWFERERKNKTISDTTVFSYFPKIKLIKYQNNGVTHIDDDAFVFLLICSRRFENDYFSDFWFVFSNVFFFSSSLFEISKERKIRNEMKWN